MNKRQAELIVDALQVLAQGKIVACAFRCPGDYDMPVVRPGCTLDEPRAHRYEHSGEWYVSVRYEDWTGSGWVMTGASAWVIKPDQRSVIAITDNVKGDIIYHTFTAQEQQPGRVGYLRWQLLNDLAKEYAHVSAREL